MILTSQQWKDIDAAFQKTRISLRALERMVESSLDTADLIVRDWHIQRGEVWEWRHAWWRYWPYELEIIYRVEQGLPEILGFRYKDYRPEAVGDWSSMSDTKSYRQVIERADQIRAAQP